MNIRLAAFALLITSGAVSSAIAPASADEVFVVGPHGVPAYTVWRPEWDQFHADRRHVILGTVAGFEPYRLQIARRNGRVRAIDLKNGTVILPTGATPTVNDRVAAIGYYSHGTFIANRILLRR
jgi:hypothetical protein